MKTITVAQQHINKGIRRYDCGCPIALALIEQCMTPQVRVRGMFADIAQHNVKLPKRAQKFICDFDNERPVKPFTFRVNL